MQEAGAVHGVPTRGKEMDCNWQIHSEAAERMAALLSSIKSHSFAPVGTHSP